MRALCRRAQAAWARSTRILICVGDPRKGGSIGRFLHCFASFSPVLDGGGPQSGSRWSARSAARTNDLEAGEDPPHTRRARDRQRRCDSTHLLPPVRKGGSGDAWRVPAPSLIWVHGRKSGDMMIDGVPGVREWVRPLILSGTSTQQPGGGRSLAGADRRHQLIYGQGTRTTHGQAATSCL